jgi:epoxyqueuosine reductase
VFPPIPANGDLDAEELPSGAARHSPPARRLDVAEAAGYGATGGGALELSAERASSDAGLADAIRDAALALGFARVGFSPIEPFADSARALERWLAAGHHGEMGFMAGSSRADPRELLPRARTLIVVALAYGRGVSADARRPPLPLTGLVARYARGDDYHSVMKDRLRQLADRCAELSGREVLARPCVDTAPLLEREAARRAGIGFTAKNTMTIAPGLGSFFVLGELLVDLELRPSTPLSAGCGSCRTCLDACPTGAFVDAYTLDARRCISYLTIELTGPIPRELRPAIGRWVFGCDVCQEVCPYNQSSRARDGDAAFRERPATSEVDLVALLELTASGYRRLRRRSAILRVNRVQLQRNAAVALGNSRAPDAVVPLARALAANPSPLVRGHAAWALGRLGTPAAREALAAASAAGEADGFVIEEIALAKTLCS